MCHVTVGEFLDNSTQCVDCKRAKSNTGTSPVLACLFQVEQECESHLPTTTIQPRTFRTLLRHFQQRAITYVPSVILVIRCCLPLPPRSERFSGERSRSRCTGTWHRLKSRWKCGVCNCRKPFYKPRFLCSKSQSESTHFPFRNFFPGTLAQVGDSWAHRKRAALFIWKQVRLSVSKPRWSCDHRSFDKGSMSDNPPVAMRKLIVDEAALLSVLSRPNVGCWSLYRLCWQFPLSYLDLPTTGMLW